MADPYVREVGTVTDMDGVPVVIGVDYDAVTIGSAALPACFTQAQAEEFAQLFISAVWQAGAQQGRMGTEPAMNAAEDAMDP
jgi:hypothetical protein